MMTAVKLECELERELQQELIFSESIPNYPGIQICDICKLSGLNWTN